MTALSMTSGARSGRLFLTLLVTLCVLGACNGDDPAVELRFSAIPDQDETLLREKFAPVARYLSEALGVKVRYVHAGTYADAVDLFKNGDVQLAWFGGLSGVQARAKVPGARAIAQGEADPDFRSYFIAHRSTGLTRSEAFPQEIAGKSFSFGSKGSTSGRLMPEHFIRKHSGKAPADLLGEIGFSGSHDKTAELVEAGTFQVGAINYKVYDRRVANGETDPEVCRIIWRTPGYPDYNFTAHPVLEETFGTGFIDKLQKALIEMTDESLLAAFPRKRLIPAKNADFEPVAVLARELGFLR